MDRRFSYGDFRERTRELETKSVEEEKAKYDEFMVQMGFKTLDCSGRASAQTMVHTTDL